MEERKYYDFSLSRIKSNDASAYYKHKYFSWLVSNARKVTNADGEELKGMLDKYFGGASVEPFTEKGFELTEQQFVVEELKRVEAKHKATTGSAINRDFNLAYGVYLEYLKRKAIELNNIPSKQNIVEAEGFKYVAIDANKFELRISEALQKNINKRAWGERIPTSVRLEQVEVCLYNFFMVWLVIGDRLPKMDLPHFDRTQVRKAYLKGFEQGLNDFSSKYGSRYVSGNSVMIANIKQVYERDHWEARKKHIPYEVYKSGTIEIIGKKCGELYGLEQLAKNYPVDLYEFLPNDRPLIPITESRILKWIEQAQKYADVWAQQKIESISLDLDGLTTEEKNRELQKERALWIDQRKKSRSNIYDVLKPVEENAKSLMFFYSQEGFKIVALAGAGEATPNPSPEGIIKATIAPALKAKRIVELLNDLMQNIDKPPAVCSEIPDHLLEKIYPEIDCYLKGVTQKHFIECFKYKKRLEVKEGWNIYLIYLFRQIWRREGINLNTLRPVFGNKFKNDKARVEEKRKKMEAIYSNVKG